MRRCLWLLPLCSLLVGCLDGHIATDPTTGQRVYTSPHGEFSVMVPRPEGARLKANEWANENVTAVTFTTGYCYWMVFGAFDLDWVSVSKTWHDARERGFLERVCPVLSRVSAERIDEDFTELTSGPTTVGERAAYRVVGFGVKDRERAFWSATAIDFGEDIAFAYCAMPLYLVADEPRAYAGSRVWRTYEEFVHSIRRGGAAP